MTRSFARWTMVPIPGPGLRACAARVAPSEGSAMRWMGRTFATGVWLVALAGGASPAGWGAAATPVIAPAVRADSARAVAGPAAVEVSAQHETNPGSRLTRMP